MTGSDAEDRTQPAAGRGPGAKITAGLDGNPTVPSPHGAAPDGAPAAAGQDRAPGPMLPQVPGVRLEQEIARGGMGVVYRGVQEVLEREVAVKVLAPHLQSAQFVQRFRREAKLLAGLSHPHIVACHSAGIAEDGACYLVMEYIAGPTLRQLLDRDGPLAAAEALQLVRALAQALERAQQAGVIHRDVKPENVLLQPCADAATAAATGAARPCEGARFPFVPKLADLGLARRADEVGELTAPGVVMGTTATMAPEQFDDPDQVDQRADVYGLGCVLFHALTGRPAFRGGGLTDVILQKRAPRGPDPRQHRGDVPEPVASLVQSMLASDPADRPQRHADVVAACTRLLAGPTGSIANADALADGALAGGSAGSGRRTPGAWIGMLVVLAIGGGTAAWIALAAQGPPDAPPMPPRPQPQQQQPPPSLSDPTDGVRIEPLAAATDLLALDPAASGYVQHVPEGTRIQPFSLFDPGIYNGRCLIGEARLSLPLPDGDFELTGEVEIDHETWGRDTEAGGIALSYAGRPQLVLCATPQGDALQTVLGARTQPSLWPPEPLQELVLPHTSRMRLSVRAAGSDLEISWGSRDTGWRTSLDRPAGPGELQLLVRKGQARFGAFQLATH